MTAEQDVMDANVQAFLTMIRFCEGTADDNGYRALFGYTPGPPGNARVFSNSYIDHPNTPFPFTQTDGVVKQSTAAGAYQIIHPTWVLVAGKLGLTDFSPASQDAVAEYLIAQRGAMADVKAGLLQRAIDRCSPVWASLPASIYPQPHRTYAYAEAKYLAAGGSLA